MANPVNELENLEAEFRDRMNNYVFDVLEKWAELQDYNFAIVAQQKDPQSENPQPDNLQHTVRRERRQ